MYCFSKKITFLKIPDILHLYLLLILIFQAVIFFSYNSASLGDNFKEIINDNHLQEIPTQQPADSWENNSDSGRFKEKSNIPIEKISQIPNPDFGTLIYDIQIRGQTFLLFSNDGNLLATRSATYVYVWNVSTGSLLRKIQEPNVYDIAFSSDDRSLFILKTSKLNNSEKPYTHPIIKNLVFSTGSIETVYESDFETSYKCQLARNGDYLLPEGLSGQETGIFRMINISNGNVETEIETNGSIGRLPVFSPDKTIVAYMYGNYRIGFQNVTSGKQIIALPNKFNIHSDVLRISYDNSLVAIRTYVSSNSFIEIWDINKGVLYKKYQDFSTFYDFSPNLNTIFLNNLYSGFNFQESYLIDFKTNEILLNLSRQKTGDIIEAVFSPDGTILVTRSNENIQFWNVVKNKMTYVKHVIGNDIWNSFEYSPALNQLVYSDSGVIKLWDVDKEEQGSFISNTYYLNYPKRIKYSPDGTKLAVSTWTNLFILDTKTTELITNITFHSNSSYDILIFSPDGEEIAFWEYDLPMNNSISVWDATNGQLLRTKVINDLQIEDIFYSKQGELIGIISNPINKTIFLDLFTNKTIFSLSEDFRILYPYSERSTFDFSSDGKMLVLAQGNCELGCLGGSLSVWNLTNYKMVFNSSGPYAFTSVEFSPDDRLLVSGLKRCPKFGCTHVEKPIQIWNVSDWNIIQNLSNVDNHSITSVKFSSDGTKIISGGSAGIQIWDISSLPVYLDHDLDGMDDDWEKKFGLNPKNFWDKFVDPDQDELMNSMEYFLGTNPLNNDTNGNNISDHDEFFPNLKIEIPNEPSSKNLFQFIFILAILISMILGILFIHKKSTLVQQKTSNNLQLLELDQHMYLRPIFNKIIIGLENTKSILFKQESSIKSEELVDNLGITKTDSISVVSFLLPTDFRNDIKSEIRGRTVLILIELAYQYPLKSHASFISKVLNIPSQTMSKEIKRLIDLNYIEHMISKETLSDSRYKFYSLTKKGILFLSLLKETLSITLMNLTIDSELV